MFNWGWVLKFMKKVPVLLFYPVSFAKIKFATDFFYQRRDTSRKPVLSKIPIPKRFCNIIHFIGLKMSKAGTETMLTVIL